MSKILQNQPDRDPLAISSPQLLLAVTAGHESERITALVAALALRGSLHIISGNDWVPGYALARALRRSTVEVKTTLERVRLARAFTCYQLLDLLAGAVPDGGPVLVLDFLHTFYSPDIPLAVRFRVLHGCGKHFQRLAARGPVAVAVRHMPSEDYRRFYPPLALLADRVFLPAPESATASQPGLFVSPCRLAPSCRRASRHER